MNKEKILQNYGKMLAGSGRTRKLYLSYAQMFLDYAGEDMGKETILNFLERLRRKGYADGSINFIFRIIRRLYATNNLEWPFRRGEAPQIREDNVRALAIHPDIVAEMIEKIKKEGTPQERAILAVASVYGTRRIELMELTQDDVMIKDRVIHIKTAKHGRERMHLIPEEIVPYLADYDFNTRLSEFGIFSLWYQIEHKVGLKHTDRVGFHSLRRVLNTLLLNYLPEVVVASFLRWKQRTSNVMPFRYSAQKFVGREGITTTVVGQAKDVDTKVFEVHPFLPYWGDKQKR